LYIEQFIYKSAQVLKPEHLIFLWAEFKGDFG